MKRCKVCGEVKPLDEFYAMPRMRDGHRNDCKACNLAAKKARYRTDPEAAKARVKAWQQANREQLQAYRRLRREEPEVKARERAGHLKRKYGITLEQYDEMLAAQGGVCAVCGREPRDDISLHVDHDHETGALRGLLCFRCNNSLGDLGDDPDLLRRAASYLDSHDPETVELAQRTRARVAALHR